MHKMAVVLSRKRDPDYVGGLLNQLEETAPDFYLDGASIGGRYYNRLPVSKKVHIYNEPWYTPYHSPQGDCPLIDYPDEYLEYNFVNVARVRNINRVIAEHTGIFTSICYIIDEPDGNVALVDNPGIFRRLIECTPYKNSYWVVIVDIHY